MREGTRWQSGPPRAPRRRSGQDHVDRSAGQSGQEAAAQPVLRLKVADIGGDRTASASPLLHRPRQLAGGTPGDVDRRLTLVVVSATACVDVGAGVRALRRRLAGPGASVPGTIYMYCRFLTSIKSLMQFWTVRVDLPTTSWRHWEKSTLNMPSRSINCCSSRQTLLLSQTTSR